MTQVLFGEFLIEIALGIVIGLFLSQWIVGAIARFHSVRRRIDRLDLVAALKTRD